MSKEKGNQMRPVLPSATPTSNACSFPPSPPSKELKHSIISGFCNEMHPKNFEEQGCAVCGKLTLLKDLTNRDNLDVPWNILCVEGITRKERFKRDDPIEELSGPILAPGCDSVCSACIISLKKRKVPKMALANGLWIGEVPNVLQDLTFAEQILISRIRHNRCLMRVSSGRAMMTENVIMFANPTVKVYHALPPSLEELDEVLAFTYTGSTNPTEKDFARTPMLVRRIKVCKALEWLKLNHADYADLEISQENLKNYPLNGIPVKVDFHRTSTTSNKIPSAMSVHDIEDEEGTETGPCSFTVHGLTGVEYSKLSKDAKMAASLTHLATGGNTLAVGHAPEPESIFNNPQCYPQMFPWLFPYGKGGIEQTRHYKTLGHELHKRHLLLYYDKRFQTDVHFPIITFNHNQIRSATHGSRVTSKRKIFADVAHRLKQLDHEVLKTLAQRMEAGEHVIPESEAEKLCFNVLSDLDHIGSHVQGSLTNKKFMRSEIWSLMSFLGAPSWFVTFSPADVRHPLCLYLADSKTKFSPVLRCSRERSLLISRNPVAAARFFDIMVKAFIKHVLGMSTDHAGLYGDTAGYYGTVEQQGRLTLHLHMLLWISGALSPQDIRDRLMKADSSFQREMTAYLESVNIGEFKTGTMEDVRRKVPFHPKGFAENIAPAPPPGYEDPTQTFPVPPPPLCHKSQCSSECETCAKYDQWQLQFLEVFDDLFLRSNVHSHINPDDPRLNATKKGKDKISPDNPGTAHEKPKGCMNKHGICTAHFPRKTFDHTVIDCNDGRIDLKKLEPMVNNVTPELTYLMRSNTDVTSLLSGTSIKATVSYVSDYISKQTLKTHQIFSSAYDVFQKNSDLLIGEHKDHEAGRNLMLKLVNNLSTKLEIGSPMACLYLLGNNDHYTSHEFIVVGWRAFVNQVKRTWSDVISRDKEGDVIMSAPESTVVDTILEINEENVEVKKEFGEYIAKTKVDDYMFRPVECEHLNLYEWMQCTKVEKRTPKQMKIFMELILELGNIDDDKIKEDHDDNDQDMNASSTLLAFMPDHPQYLSHAVRLLPERCSFVVPNFAGGALPRCDQGDREYYCTTMLCLYKPWRTGMELKKQDQSWDSAFRTFQFTKHQRKLMENFNLRYECLDARDDFHALMKAQEKKSDMEYSAEHRWGDLEDDYQNDMDSSEFGMDFNPTEDDYSQLGPLALRRKKNEREIDSVLKSSGWMDSIKNISPLSSLNALTPGFLSRNSWSNLVKDAKKALVDLRLASFPVNAKTSSNSPIDFNEVKVVGPEFFLKDYQAKEADAQAIVEDIIVNFTLNKEQERAFRIIANHASSLTPPPLKMYLGGMGGTGKTQVIKALISLFVRRNEAHRFAVVAPTGNAAANIGGSTYHSLLGIRIDEKDGHGEHIKNEAALIAEAKTKLKGVEYILVDEISMVSSREFYSICARLSEILNKPDIVFGGVNMIVAGDFAQLPPVAGHPLYHQFTNFSMDSKQKEYDQLSLLGLLYWHQFTTVVILKENMRQKTQSSEDAKLRNCLENMRYGSCTQENLEFLYSRIAGPNPGQPQLTDPHFRNVPIITAWNAQKDRINDIGALRFAKDTGQNLTHFYSMDSIASSSMNKTNVSSKKLKIGPSMQKISSEMCHALWSAPPATSQHFAGKLSLCIGMPVMIRNNDATELCITKGQEGTVAGWESIKGPEGVDILDTLFVKLTNPAKDVCLPGLPLNVVPMVRTSLSICASLPNDTIQYIKREQVQVLPCFAMTDFAAQGKTRPYNVVELMHGKNHLSYYTSLSRSATAEGTVIIQGFDSAKITKGIHGNLRQEFRELNLLDEISEMRYHGILPSNVIHDMRSPTIRAYRLWTQRTFEDIHSDWHKALQWNNKEDASIPTPLTDPFWDPSIAKTLIKKIEEQHMHNKILKKDLAKAKKVHSEKKKRSGDDQDTQPLAKRHRRNPLQQPRTPDPVGTKWDSNDYSCAYDAFIVIVRQIWSENPDDWTTHLSEISQFMGCLVDGFHAAVNGRYPLETARNDTRNLLRHVQPCNYPPPGFGMTDITQLIKSMMACSSWTSYTWRCVICGHTDLRPGGAISQHTAISLTETNINQNQNGIYISNALNSRINGQVPCPPCSNSSRSGMMSIVNPFHSPPHLMFTSIIETNRYILIDYSFILSTNNLNFRYMLKGVIYYGANHFVARIVDGQGWIWYHDGMVTGNTCQRIMHLQDVPFPKWWNSCADRTASHVAYVLHQD